MTLERWRYIVPPSLTKPLSNVVSVRPVVPRFDRRTRPSPSRPPGTAHGSSGPVARYHLGPAVADIGQLSRWFIPVDGWSAPISEISVDARVGGTWRVSMVDDTGTGYPAVFVYREITEPERLVFTTGMPDQDPNDPGIATATVTLTEAGGKTEMTYQGISADPDQSEVGGWQAMFERMASQLAE